MNNYNTKFKLKDKVKITKGLYKGRVGKVIDYFSNTTVGLSNDNFSRGIVSSSGVYTIQLGFFTSVYVEENQIDLCSG